jgi:hypothetical protein
MKKLFPILCFLLLFQAHAQITIDRNDMPNIGDTIRRSMVYSVNSLNYTNTGANFTWDFSSLSRTGQNVSSFLSPSVTPSIYQLVFNLPFDPNKATICSPQTEFDTLSSFSLTDTYSFFRETNSSFSFLGLGATINSIPLTIKYNSPDVWYRFPMVFGSADSSTSTFSINLAGLGYIYTKRHRVNHVDGWGALTTPLGTFNCMRVKSVVTEFDSIFLDSLQVGIPISRYYTEYKWLGDNYGLPLLEIVEEGVTITVRYKDVYHPPVIAAINADKTQVCRGETVLLTASASGGTPPYTYSWINGSTSQSIQVNPLISMAYSVVVTDAAGESDTKSIFINVHQPPTVNLGNDTTITQGSSCQLNAVIQNGTAPFLYQWTPTFGLNASNLQNPIASPNVSTNYIVMITDSNNCYGSDTILIGVTPVGFTVSGALIYENQAATFLANVLVYLKDSADNIVSLSSSDTNGFYQFSNVIPGNYKIVVNCLKNWGGGNATDALIVLRHFVGVSALSGLKLQAADTDNSGYVNSVDGMLIARRFVGLINSFPAGDWVFEIPEILVVGNVNVLNIKGLCVSDVDGSFTPQN